MASHPTVGDLKQDALCPQCKGYLKDPVLMECGHNFCRDCISSYYQKWNKKSTPVQCPVCSKPLKDGKLRPNEQLGNIIEKLKHLPPTLGKDYLCPKHKKKMDLFCAEDVEPVCFLCKHSPEHKLHTLLPPEDVAEQYKDQIHSRLALLGKTRENVESSSPYDEKEIQAMLSRIEAEKRKIETEFNDLRAFLDENEKFLLDHMKAVQKEVTKNRKQHILEVSEEISSLRNTIREMEESCKQPPIEFLLDFKKNLQRCDNMLKDLISPFEARWKVWDFCDVTSAVERISEDFKDAMTSTLQLHEADVTLKPETAHPQLVISKDCKSVRMGEVYRSLPRNPERFDEWPFVLGAEGFVSGRHFWEVAVAREDAWGVGVARMSVARAGDIDFSPEQGFWAVGKWEGNYTAYNPPFYTALTLHRVPKRIRVSLNCDGGWVTFFDADTALPVFTYSASFSGETIFPFFYVHGSARLSISPGAHPAS
ncbi:Tripartite motif-containing protein 10 [Varanus komodoensis]|uniref:tripartite motif-containing protein 10-like n=1 Tax=Varanus komodoensis TaxID=61221 RepID=UPI001CF7AEEB|nr:tripartite motif-containing protein 10-like [Varanus komodoensis]KAF7236111.1 Tripartite motif-containing protein 10 [Varanus komodoensis]